MVADVQLQREAQQRCPDEVLVPVVEQAATLGGVDSAVYLCDYEHATLRPESPAQSPIEISDTTAGDCFATQQLRTAPAVDGGLQVFVPVSERAQRLGVLSVRLPDLRADADLPPALRTALTDLGLSAAMLVATSSAYCDRFHRQRRTRPLALAAEMQWALLPPLSFDCAGTAIAGMLEPAYDVGGDSFDYAVDDGVLSFGIFDAMGHGLNSAVLSCLAVGAYRHGRRERADLVELRERMDAALAGQFEQCFVTALTAQLDMRSGVLQWHSAGHPAPLLVRAGEAVRELTSPPAVPLGLGVRVGDDNRLIPSSEQLQPGDQVLLYTDGVVEGRDSGGTDFGLPQLQQLFLEFTASGHLRSEVLRRLGRAVHDWQGGQLRDDATLLLVEWSGPAV